MQVPSVKRNAGDVMHFEVVSRNPTPESAGRLQWQDENRSSSEEEPRDGDVISGGSNPSGFPSRL